DLVGTRVGQVLALEVQPEAGDPRSASAGPTETRRLRADGFGQPVGAVQRRRTPGEGAEELAQLRPKHRVLAERLVCLFELLESSHQGLGDIAAAEVALESPPPGSVSVEESGVDGRGTERDVGAV